MTNPDMEKVKSWFDNSPEFQAGALFAYLTVLELLKKMDPERNQYGVQAVGVHVARLALQVGP